MLSFRAINWLFCLVSIGVLTGCGFQLQGAVKPPAAMQRTYIDTSDERSLFARALEKRLRDAGVTLVDSEADATAVFVISFDDTGQRVLSVSARNVPTEYEVYYTISYVVLAGRDDLVENQTVTLTRDYTYDTTLVLGKAREEAILRDAIVEDLVRVVMKQVAAL